VQSRSAGQITLADFTMTEDGLVTACPTGQVPEEVKTDKNGFIAILATEHCSNCPRQNCCPVKEGKLGRFLRYDAKAASLAHRRAKEKEDDFRDKYRFRTGVEATMSEFDHRTEVKRLRVRGMKAVQFAVFMKVIGLNILRTAAFVANPNKKIEKQ